jgi:IS30 family transposase
LPSRYSHLSASDRLIIEVYLRFGVRPATIASSLGRHRSTICREISRAQAFKGTSTYIAHFGAICMPNTHVARPGWLAVSSART